MKMMVFLGLVAGLLPAMWTHADDRKAENPADPSKFTFERRLVFYAVLEGLFEDGVAGEALELLIPDVEGMWIEEEPDKTNFVYSCPICTPVFDALRLYKVRSPFYSQKITAYNTFGPGLSEAMMTRLRGAPPERREAIQELIETWVSRRLDLMKLAGDERAGIEGRLQEMKKEGEAALKRFQEGGHGGGFGEYYANWEGCAACSGAASAAH